MFEDGGFASGLAADGLPVVAPTASRVAALLDGADPSFSLGIVPPSDGEATLGRVAACAVMAGCADSSQLAILVAAVKAALRPEFNAHGAGATTMGCTPLVIVSGPARRAAGVNCGSGALGSGTRANAAIGRALKLCLHHIGGAALGGTESTTIGTPAKYAACFGENEETVAGTEWAVSSSGSSVTVAPATGFAQVVDFDTTEGSALVGLIARTLTHCCWGARFPLASSAVVVASPEHAATLASTYATRREFQVALWHACNRCCALHVGSAALRALGLPAVLAPLASVACLAFAVAGRPLLPKFESPEAIRVVVAGGPAGKFTMCVAGFGAGLEGMPTARLSVPTTEPVEPLSSFPRALEKNVLQDPDFLMDPRPPAREGRTKRKTRVLSKIALVDISKGGSKEFLGAVASLLPAEIPVARYRKPTFARRAPDSLLAKIVEDACSHVIIGLAD